MDFNWFHPRLTALKKPTLSLFFGSGTNRKIGIEKIAHHTATDTKDNLSEDGLQRPDIADRAQVESNAAIQLRTRDRERKLINKIDSALRRIDLGTYGYCEETDEPIGIKRLIARPIAALRLHAQERHEKMERIHKDD